MAMPKLGNVVRDLITGYEGTVTARVEYINGCVQFGVVPKSKDGKMEAAEFIDFQRLEVIGEGMALPSRETGGPQRDTPRASYKG